MNTNPNRKDSHLEICLSEDVEFAESSGAFSKLHFEHDALPEISKSKIDTSVTLLGKKLSAPLIIGAMTGGTDRAAELNRKLALAAQECGVGFALGSQRPVIENPSLISSYNVRQWAPKLPLLFGNIGAVQFNYGVDLAKLQNLIKQTACDAFNFHLNPLQEAAQPEGDTDFSGLLSKLSEIVPHLGVPAFAKEVGAGISNRTAEKLSRIPFAGIETAGLGGTSWSFIESKRTSDKTQKSIGETFAQWGVPTAESIVHCRKHFGDRVVISSGGIRNGIEVAKSLALGADAAAMALPILKAAEKSTEEAVYAIRLVIEELKTVMFLTGSKNIEELKKCRLERTK